MFTIRGLSVGYGSDPVLEDVDLDLASGRIHGLIGVNGAGKTTLLDSIFGLIRVDRSLFQVDGAVLHRKQIAYLEAVNYFYPNITGREYLKLFLHYNRGFTLEAWQEIFRLPLDGLIAHYSAGMKKKLALWAVLIPDREIVMLDEPFNGLDLESVYILQLIVKKLRERGKTVVITSHIFSTLSDSCDYIHLLENKRIRMSYPATGFNTLKKYLEIPCF